MDSILYKNYLALLKSELIPALGCTEPIAIAYAAAKATAVLACKPTHIVMWCSGNIVKNAQGVVVPNSGGLRGIEAASILGVLGGKAEKELEVLEEIDSDKITEAKTLLGTGYCECKLAKGVANLYLYAQVFAGNHTAEVEIVDKHTNITKILKDGQVIFEKDFDLQNNQLNLDKSQLNVRRILEFADVVEIEDVKDILDRQIQMNYAISEEGLNNNYGAAVGKTLLFVYGDNIEIRAKARAAAGSDARMNGCSMPVVINSGSGNQGMTVSLPVVEYAKELNVSQERLYRALVISNLIALHQKKHIGSLSAYCGAVCAACGSGAAIAYLHGKDYEVISNTIINTIANVGGMICDGAKSSCAAKIASAVDAAIMAYHLSENQHAFESGEGLVQDDVERTIQNLGQVGREGMQATDREILDIMLNK